MTRSLFAYAVAALGRRRGRAFALGAGLAITVTLLASVVFLTESLRGEAARATASLPDVVVQRLVAGRPTTVHEADVARLGQIDSVRSARVRVWGYVFLPAIQGNVTIVGVPKGAPPLGQVKGELSSGRDLHFGAHEMVAGADFARIMGLAPGDKLGLPTTAPSPSLKLVGVFGSPVELYTADVVLCDEDDARAILGLAPDEGTDISLDLANPEEARVVAGTVLDRMPEARVVDKRILARVYTLSYGRRAGLLLAASIPALIALLVLAWDRASGVGPEEQREIAILKAVGFGTRHVLWVKLIESLMVASLASALGLLAAYAWVFWLGAPGLRPALVGWSVLYPTVPLTPAVDFAQLLAIAAAVVGPFVGLSVVPAWRASIVDPMSAMRGG